MPIYEYRCGGCKRHVSIFFPSFSAVESRTAAGENRCPRCGSTELSRLMSRVNTVRADGADIDDLTGSQDGMLDDLEGEDPRAVARWARRMKESMGDDLDMGPEFDQALARIEAGEDPDRVMEDIDVDALGPAGAGDEEYDGEAGEDIGPSSIGLG